MYSKVKRNVKGVKRITILSNINYLYIGESEKGARRLPSFKGIFYNKLSVYFMFAVIKKN